MALSRVPGDENLYVGGIFTLQRKADLETNGITHIVSVLKYNFKDFQEWEKYDHLSIEVDDVDDENLLENFEKSGAWIENAFREGKNGKPGGVLVHCAMGRSRSVTIVLAYLLRKNPSLLVEDALSLVRESRPIAEPNDGFMAQLKLYQEMGYPRDIQSHPKYQRWLYQQELDSAIAAGMAPDRVRFRDEEDNEKGKDEGSQGLEIELRCRKCRCTLATTPFLIEHAPKLNSNQAPASNAGPIASLITAAPHKAHTACSSHFIHPLSWMRQSLEQGLLQGRLGCPNPKCSAQLGRYSWQGQRCSCNTWVCPSFSLHKSRCDEIRVCGPSSVLSITE